MSSGGVSRLCRLVDVSLRHHKEVLELVELSRDKEKKLLISLSLVFRQIQGWTSEVGSIPLPFERFDNSNESCASFCENHHCLTDIVATLIKFLTVESKYVQHSVGNILVEASKFIAGAQAKWKSFVDMIGICLQVAISNALLHSSVNCVEHLKYDPPAPAVLQVGLKNSNWRTVAEILRVLRAIIKTLKEEENEHDVGCLEILVGSLSMCFSKLPWNTLDASLARENIIGQERSSESSLMNVAVTESEIIFLGSLVQLFCSLVETVHEIEGSANLQDKRSLTQRIKAVAPQIAEWCLAKEWIQHDMHILPYFQHKILMLMSRLGSQVCMDCSAILLWLQLLQKFYGEILTKTISPNGHDLSNCLEGSPFLWNEESNHFSSCHLQRQSNFLFLRFSMCLIVWEESIATLCTCGTVDSVSTPDSKTVAKCHARRKCIAQFYEWLQLHFPFNKIEDNEIYINKCIDFSSSFIKLYIHEDDLLFEVLLLMFRVATYADKQTFKDKGVSLETDEDALFGISELFNPVLLFHVFLAEVQYDHQLLLDYLISKDSGTRCAEYLLKCLRKVCDSWKMFVELPLGLENDGNQMLKKRKISPEIVEAWTSTASQRGLAISNKECSGKDVIPQNKRSGTKGLCFVKAKTCLLSLKNALEKLHKRSLFPYNPEVLLRRLKKFEELCG